MSLINDQLKRVSQSQQQEDDTVRINLKPSSTAAFKPQPTWDSALPSKPQPAWDSPPPSRPQPSRDLVPAPKPQPSREPAPAPNPEPTWGWPPLPKPQSGRGLAFLVLVILLIAAAGAFIGIRHLSRNLPAFTAKFPISHPVKAALPAPPPAPRPATEHTVTVTAHAPMPMPPLKIQGITYYDAKWQAIINGKTVYVGNTVKGFRVAAISRNSVLFIAPDGSQRKLGLGE